MKKLLSMSLALVMIAASAVGCGKDDDSDESSKSASKSETSEVSSPFVGKWEAEKLVGEDGTEMKDFLGIPFSACFQFEFLEDGTVKICEELASQSEENKENPTGVWKANGDSSVTVTAKDAETGEDQSMEFKLEDDKLVVKDFDEETKGALYLVKVDEFTKFDFEEFAQSFNFGDLGAGDE